uniref:Uncharacterized protein n=1 Tax=Anguilla anguilla TaxID=7936 RepID=A0A0E9QSC4_ANGAN
MRFSITSFPLSSGRCSGTFVASLDIVSSNALVILSPNSA